MKLLRPFMFFLLPFYGYSQIKKNISVESIIEFSKKQIGIHYHYAHCNPKEGFDCSGFVFYVFKHFDINVPRASMDYENMGKVIPIDSCRPGDVIVFTGTNEKNRHPGHVGIVLSKEGENIRFIHSSSSKIKSGVKISNFKDSPGYKIRFIKIVRLFI